MTYNVFGGTLNLAQPQSITCDGYVRYAARPGIMLWFSWLWHLC